jgi:hypothetical protein
VFDDSVYLTRKKFGARLALEHPVDADVVAPVPDSGTYAALGFAEAAGISFDISIMRNHYIGRTFIKPSPDDRKTAVNMKLNPIELLQSPDIGNRHSFPSTFEILVESSTSPLRQRGVRQHRNGAAHPRPLPDRPSSAMIESL